MSGTAAPAGKGEGWEAVIGLAPAPPAAAATSARMPSAPETARLAMVPSVPTSTADGVPWMWKAAATSKSFCRRIRGSRCAAFLASLSSMDPRLTITKATVSPWRPYHSSISGNSAVQGPH